MKHPPLIDIPLNHVIVDELHLFLRITDVVLRNLIQHVIEEDLKTTRKADLLSGPHLTMLVNAFENVGLVLVCGVSKRVRGAKLTGHL